MLRSVDQSNDRERSLLCQFCQDASSLRADMIFGKDRLEAELLFLRHQLNIALRRRPARLRLRGSDRALLVWMTRLWPSLLGIARVVEPATILRWHRAGFRSYWRWKSRKRAGRPRIDRDLRDLIRRMSRENPLWGAPRIHGELLKLGFELAKSTVSTYMLHQLRCDIILSGRLEEPHLRIVPCKIDD